MCRSLSERRIRAPLENGPRHPRTEFFVANALLFTERLFATGGRDEFFEDFQTDGFDTRAFQNCSRIDIHVVAHAMVHQGIGGDFNRGSRLASKAASATGREDHQLTSACDKSGD